MYDVRDEWIRKVREFTRAFPKGHSDIHRLLTRNRIFVERTKGIGVLTA
jgi:NADH-quinone oxidoreductase subunit D